MVSKSASSSSFDSINKTKSSAPIKSTSSASSTSTSSPKVNMNNIINLVKKADKDLDNVLSKQAIVLKLERQSGIKKTVMVYSLAASIVFLILYRLASNFVVSVALFAYPLILSLEAVESHDKTKDAQILAYWSTIALIQLSEALLPFIREYVPLYDLLKIAVAVYLYLPQTKGSLIVYDLGFKPLLAILKTFQQSVKPETKIPLRKSDSKTDVGEN